MVRGDAEKSVVVEEAHQRGRGKIERPAGGDAPDGRAHRNQIEPQEVIAQAVTADEFVERHRLEGFVVQSGVGHTEEAHDLAEQLEKARTDQIGALGKDAVETHAVVFHVEAFVPDTEAHFGRLDRDAEFFEQADEIRVGHLVEDHEARVDGHAASLLVDFDGIRMAADLFLALEECQLIAVAQQPCRPESGNAAADDGQTFFAHSGKCSVGVPADEFLIIGAGDGAATWATLTPKPASRCALPLGRRTRARGAGF